MAKRKNVIPNDGYTLPGFIDESPMNEAIRFQYRAVSSEQQTMIEASLKGLEDTKSNPARYYKQADVIVSRLVSWDVKDEKGESLPIKAKTLRTLSATVFWRLYGIIMGNVPSDFDPTWDDETKTEENHLQSEAAEQGVAVAKIREAEDEKNSG